VSPTVFVWPSAIELELVYVTIMAGREARGRPT
jgi:hypothetical protein